MKLMLKSLTAITLSLSTLSAFAMPTYLTTHNETDVESNAFVVGSGQQTPSPYPTLAHSTRQVYWTAVRMACYGKTTGNKCSAVIKMETNTSNPVEIGTLAMDLVTGEITPAVLKANGYTVTVNGPGESTITKD
jgi:hypothetical protein